MISITISDDGSVTFTHTGVVIEGRYFCTRTRSWVRRTAAQPRQVPVLESRRGTPKELARAAIERGDFVLAGEYLLQAEED